jgi:hypothetical protein
VEADPGQHVLSYSQVLAAGSFSDLCEGKCLVRYAWMSLPFEYKAATVYAKAEVGDVCPLKFL